MRGLFYDIYRTNLTFKSRFLRFVVIFRYFRFFGTWTLVKPKNRFFKKPGIFRYTEKPPQPTSYIGHYCLIKNLTIARLVSLAVTICGIIQLLFVIVLAKKLYFEKYNENLLLNFMGYIEIMIFMGY